MLDVLVRRRAGRGRAHGQDEDGTQREVRAKVVIDASGQSTHDRQSLQARVNDPELKKGALWTYFEGAYRDAGRDEGATLVLQTAGKKGWFWYIPLHNNIVSVGVVSVVRLSVQRPGQPLEKIYNEELDRCPAVKERVSIGKRVAEFYADQGLFLPLDARPPAMAGCWWATLRIS